jgi:hypothetical protein
MVGIKCSASVLVALIGSSLLRCGGEAFTIDETGIGAGSGSGLSIDAAASGVASSSGGSSGISQSGSSTGASTGSASGASTGSAMTGSTSGGSGGLGSGSTSGAASGSGSGSMTGSTSGASTGSASGSTSGASTGGSGSSSGASDGGTKVSCPIDAPTAGSKCGQVGIECEYGSSPNLACNQLATCQAAGWTYSTESTCPPSNCPATYDKITAGALCDQNEPICAYPMGTCNCALSSPIIVVTGGPKPTWHCFAATSACVSPRPDIGTPCSDEGQSCDYGACEDGIELECLQGIWQRAFVACPG